MIVLFVLPLTSDLKGKYVLIMKYGKIRMPNKVGQNKNRRLTDVYNDNFSLNSISLQFVIYSSTNTSEYQPSLPDTCMRGTYVLDDTKSVLHVYN